MDTSESAKPKIRLAVIALRISQAIYMLFVLCLPTMAFLDPESQDMAGIFINIVGAGFILAFVIFIEFVIRSLQKFKYWAWIAGLILFGIYAPSLFLPLGLLGFFGLLSKETLVAFGVSKPSAQ